LSNALEPIASSRGHEARSLISTAALDPRQRPETLTLADVARLAAVLGR
jgi:16S rRNA A1518/A1519 N6-dimethyltransferase RsmA/KsgA/DIM1 with predicted DNA glycosylase/AP lyase activity